VFYYEVIKLFDGYLAIHIRPYSIALSVFVFVPVVLIESSCCALLHLHHLCSLYTVYLLNNMLRQAASQWVLCFSGSLPNVLYSFGCDCLCFLFSENKYDDDDDSKAKINMAQLFPS